MIRELTVENLAIIERSQVQLDRGFTVLTGETGAGKSLLIDALELALGERADPDMVRTGARSASVHLVIDLKDEQDLAAAIEATGIALDENQLFIDREVLAEGRSQCRVNGKLTPVAQLKQLGALLVDLHGQHDHQSLLDPDRHLGYLDQWIGAPAIKAHEVVRSAFSHAEDARRRLESVRAGIRDREHRLDLLRFQIQDIESVSPAVGELEQVESQLNRLKHVERLATTSSGSLDALADGENCALDQLGTSSKSLEEVARLDASLEPVVTALKDALYQLQEAVHSLRNYSEELDADPARLEDLAERQDALKRLRRKYGEDEGRVIAYAEQCRNELALLEDAEASEESLLEAYQLAVVQLQEACGELTTLRVDASARFSSIVQTQLRDLAMERAQFDMLFSVKEPDGNGADRAEFYFSANSGEDPRPLSKIASGGEISRVMLAIKTGLAGRAGVPTLIFDEVDAGLGGRAAATVAAKLRTLSEHYQVIVISHLPQIAAKANHQFRIEKVERDGRVVTSVRLLEHEERVHEIARMVAGEIVSDAALANARDILG